MSKPASVDALNRIHKKLAQAIDEELTVYTGPVDSEGERPPLQANLINAVTAFLKANDISADIGSSDDLKELRDKLTSMKGSNIVASAQESDYLN